MSDLIDRQAVFDEIWNLRRSLQLLDDTQRADLVMHGMYLVEKAIEKLPSAQPEPIRCRDCKYWQDQEEGVVEVPICARPENKYEKLPFRFIIGEDGFCNFAERREDG